ncbi:putative HMP/thiamine import ATP-binding protein YkoD [Oxobacter pfennigii]|uniref:Putative HMP/thiamine import ATP-binding protein YkoD n=1 Tax=Oxobacter pfennigii TaxID=36849 RepID=A0A0P8W5P7_9CLOT|nr:ABC transporter ATP-binding protein [Oxobacter pfennigii]KPU42998.1 putative HMP/thiamine import ATP-binding protein YkoD [Oxobacter pfennigii]
MIVFENVSFTYTGQEGGGLRDVSLTVKRGECVLLCGRSGCGKTTVTRLINGLIPHFYAGTLKGRVAAGNMEVSETPMYRIADSIGSVFQNPRTQFFNTDTDSEIAFGIENQGLPPDELKRRVEETALKLGIRELRGRNIFALSGGEKQKIAFASVYAMNPDIYLLDEPSSNLDMKSIKELEKHLRLIKERGKTILIVEHRLYYLMGLADRIIYLEDGAVTAEYTADDFLKLSEKVREDMGLRATDLGRLLPEKRVEKREAPTLDIGNLTIRHKNKVILDKVSLQASRGEVIGVVGHNGAGKTTFVRALCGLHTNCEGQFIWEGRLRNAKSRLKLSYLVMQDVNYQLFAETVEKECSLGIKKPDEQLVQRTMDDLGLTPYKTRHPNTLSGGQKQRTAVAVSMVCRKEILVFDEPTSGLDYDGMARVSGIIGKLAAMGKIIFIVTHDYELVLKACTRILHLDEGEIPEDLSVLPENLLKLRDLFGVTGSSMEEKV